MRAKFPQFLNDLGKVGTGYCHNTVSKCEFREHRCSDSNYLPRGVYEILPVFYIF